MLDSVVLAMITKDSVEGHGEVFGQVLQSTLQVPYESIILVDDSSTPRTRYAVLDFAHDFNKEVLIMRSDEVKKLLPSYDFAKPTRAVARQAAIEAFSQLFSEDWLFFVDDDAVLNPGWWGWLRHNEPRPSVGEVWGVNYDHFDTRKKYLESLGRDYVGYLIEQFHMRGGTHDTMYRREAIEGVLIPPELHWYEDSWLHHFVRCGGWDSLINPVGVDHYDPAITEPVRLRWALNYLDFVLDVTFKYGITEYVDEIRKIIRNNKNTENYTRLLLKKVIAYAMVTPFLVINQTRLEARVHGVKKAFINAVKNYYIRIWFRHQILRRAWGSWVEPPDPCEVVMNA